MVRKLYGSHAQPFVRIVYGLPVSWDSCITATCPFEIELAAWSPCNRFIAVGSTTSVKLEILDSVTLQKLQSLEFPEGGRNMSLTFSPDSHVLTASGTHQGTPLVVCWDLQTGGVAGVIRDQPGSGNQAGSGDQAGSRTHVRSRNRAGSGYPAVEHPIAYSTNGKMITVPRYDRNARAIIISIYDAVSYQYMHDLHPITNPIYRGLWVYGESLRFATIYNSAPEDTGPMSITVWEVGFTPGATKTEVETFSIPESVKFSGYNAIRFPHSVIYPQSPSAPLLVTGNSRGTDALIWDARNSKILLRRQDANILNEMAFSSDGRFFAGSFSGSGVYIWKHSPTRYVPHGKLASSTSAYMSCLLFSPNGESVILYSGSIVNIWRTKHFTAPLSDDFVDPPLEINSFLFELSPDKSLAAVVRWGDSTVTLFDIGSGAPKLTIHTGGRVIGLRVTEDAVAVISGNKVITWKLPGRSFLPGTTMSATDSALAVVLCPGEGGGGTCGLLSPDLRLSVIGTFRWEIHSATTGGYLGCFFSGERSWLTPDGHNIVNVKDENEGEVRKITAESAVGKPAKIIDAWEEQWGCPYKSFRGYRIAGGWVFGPNEKRLLILPPLWRLQSYMEERKWDGQFLVLLHGALPEPVVIDLEP